MYPKWLPSLRAFKASGNLILNTLPPLIVAGLVSDRVGFLLRLSYLQRQNLLGILFLIALPYWFHFRLMLSNEGNQQRKPKINEVERELNNLKADEGLKKMNDINEDL